MHTFKFETLNDQQTGGRTFTVKAPSQRKAVESAKLNPGENIVKTWKDGALVFDPFGGLF